MADVITRFKLETTQYDSKLRDTVKGLKEVVKQAELAGKDFKGFEKSTLDAARALGSIETSATNSKDKVKELVGAFNDMANTYNTMSKELQQGDVGKALSASMTQLQERIKDAKQELYGLGEAAEKVKSGGLFGEGGLTGMLAVAGGNLLASGITKLGSELADTVQQSIELARQGEGVRIAFERLNQPGLLDKLKEATHGTVSEMELMKQAIQFENFKLPLEDLATYLAFAQQKAKDTGQSIDYLVNSIVTGLGRQSKQILDNLGISASELTRRMNEGADMTKAVADIIREEMDKAGDYFETAADRAARAAADATNKMEELGRKAIPVAEMWSETWNTLKMGGMEFLNFVLSPIAESLREINNLLDNGGIDWDKVTSNPNNIDGSNIDDNGNYIKKPSNGNWAGYDAANGRYYNEISSMPEISVTGKAPKKKTRKTGGSKSSTPSTYDFSKILGKSLTGSVDLKEVKDQLSPFKLMLPEIEKNILGIKDADLGGALAEIGNKEVVSEIEAMNKALEQQQAAFNLAGQAAQSFGSALSSIDDPAAKAAGQVTQAIASIALGFAMASSNANTAGTGWGWLAWLAAGAAAMATTISTIHSLTGYAGGGEIKGNSYSGDNLMAMGPSGLIGLNAGEIVLNKAQQANIASGLKDGGRTINIVGMLKGEDIVMMADRYGMRTGRGELAFFKN